MQKLPTTLYPSKLKQSLLIIISLAFVTLGFVIIKSNFWIGLFNIIFFGLCLFTFIITLIPSASYLKIDEKGFEMRTLFRSTFIPWHVVNSFSTKRIFINTMVMIDFNPQYIDTSKLKSKTGAFPDTYGMSAKKLAELMNKYKAQAN
ncbi:hypothetical protein IQ37_16020 [Chryseobacterium piperi]|uniref:PH domain-containing protein n=1 Tax=Chryseobacterium piperi TaxID=558152 RepID=A0A086ASW1_9FLAO|nr:STM3941 family protein [Chryseobacterium piperi]ASW74764.1 hypothetical protein CJF12_11015 [Chryseobacterium piperi]KFF19775.1 hypothetical protein IQ37_16020 [Chryseobacterium piperi]